MKKLTFKEILIVASMLFGMFFGAGESDLSSFHGGRWPETRSGRRPPAS